jgi:thiamine kinase-like enzyme
MNFLQPPKSIDLKNSPPMFVAISNVVATFVANVKSWPGHEKYSEVLDKWDYSKAVKSIIKIVEPMKNGFRVLNHGNVWVNNFLFKYNEGKLSDVLFIDYQLVFWGSPACDLWQFFISSIRDEDKLQNFDSLMEFYHRELVSGLEKLDYQKPIPTLAELHVDLLEKGSFGRSPANTLYSGS